MTRPPKAKAIERLRRALDAIPELKQLQYDSPEVMEWRRDTRIAINHTFGGTSDHIGKFKNMGIIYNSARTRSLIHLTRLTIEGQSCPETS